MFKEMRRKDREISDEMIEEILIKGEYGTLATIGDDGYPYAVPLNYVYYNKSIYLHSAEVGHKLQNIERNNKVSFCVVTDTEVLSKIFATKYKSVIAFGTASEVEGELKDNILLQLIHKYSPEFIEQGKKYIDMAKHKTKLIEINIQHITGKARM